MRSITVPLVVGVLAVGVLVSSGEAVAQVETCGSEPISMITRGARPWRELRYAWVPGTTGASTMDMHMDMQMDVGGQAFGDSVTDVMIELETTVASVDGDGVARLEVLVRDAGMDVQTMTIQGEAVSEQDQAKVSRVLGETAQAMVGLTGWVLVDDRGGVLSHGFDLPEAVPDDIRQQFDESLTSVACLPEQPVGVGATWSASMASANGVIDATGKGVTAIESIDGSTVTFATTIEMDLAEALEASFSDLDGVEITSVDSSGTGQSRTVADLTSVDVTSDLEMDMGFTVAFEAEGTSTTVSMDVGITMTARPIE